RVGKRIERGCYALAERARVELLPSNLPIAEVDVNGNWIGESCVEVTNDVVDRSNKPHGQAALALIVSYVDLHSADPPHPSPRRRLNLAISLLHRNPTRGQSS